MRKRVILALVLVLALVMSTGCSLIIKDEAVDMATPIIEVAGKIITKGEIREMTEAYHDYNEQMYTYYYGMSYDRNSESAQEEAQSQAIQSLIETAVVEQKLDEYGLNTFTDEEMAEIEAQAQEDYELYYDTTEMFYFSDTELTGDELEAAILAEMAAMGYPDREGMVEETKSAKAQEKLRAEIVKDIAVSEEELTTEYNTMVENAKTTYDANPAAYGTALSNGENPYYAPEGYRYVKHILRQLATEDADAITELETAISEAEGDTADLQAQLDAAREAAYANLQPTVDEINAKLAEGADFDALITEYDQDPGMTAESAGYAVSEASTEWVDEFKNASMALAAVGDVSEPVRSSHGIHIIKYVSDIAAGEIGLENVREDLTAALLETKQNDHVNATLTQWVEEANAKVDEKALNN